MSRVVVVPGDGIGQEVTPQARRVLEVLDLGLEFTPADAGDAAYDATGVALPPDTRDLVADADATLFGAAGETAADVILPLRQAVGSFVNIRPAEAFPGVNVVQPGTDLVILRENTEGVYAGFESALTPDVTTLTRLVTRAATERLAEFACEFVRERGIDHVTIAHKANVMRVTDGLFLDTVETVARERGIEATPMLMDALATGLVLNPDDYHVIVTPNLAGDVLSDLAAGLVGGLGLLPSANIGPERALFEPVHGSAPDIAGEGIANPTAVILSAAMLVEYLGHHRAAERVRSAVRETLAAGVVTPDLGGTVTTAEATDAVIERL